MLNNSNELELMHACQIAQSVIAELSDMLLHHARKMGFDDVVIRKRSDGATALVAVKRREMMQ